MRKMFDPLTWDIQEWLWWSSSVFELGTWQVYGFVSGVSVLESIVAERGRVFAMPASMPNFEATKSTSLLVTCLSSCSLFFCTLFSNTALIRIALTLNSWSLETRRQPNQHSEISQNSNATVHPVLRLFEAAIRRINSIFAGFLGSNHFSNHVGSTAYGCTTWYVLCHISPPLNARPELVGTLHAC